MEYIIPNYRLDDFQDKIFQLNKRAKKLDLPEITAKEVNRESKSIKRWSEYGNDIDIDTGRRYNNFQYWEVTIQVEGDSPKLDGWTFLAKLEHTASGNIISKMSEVDLPVSYRTVRSKCDHCHVDRVRNFTFVIKHESGILKQIGSSCLKDFLGHASIESIANFYADLGLDQYTKSDSEDDELYNIAHGKFEFGLDKYLVCVSESIRIDGWISASMEGYPTKSRALEILCNTASKDVKMQLNITDGLVDKVKDIISHVKYHLSNKPNLSDYESNLLVIVNGEFITVNQSGYAASIIPFYNKLIEGELRVKYIKDNSKSVYLGEIGGKLTNITVRLLKDTELESQYGVVHLYSFLTPDGCNLSWFASNNQHLEIDQDYVIEKCTVKDHKEYKGELQTQITRAKISQ